MTEARGEWPSTAIREQILHEHKKICDATRRLETIRDLGDLLGHLREFRSLLEFHFLNEEAAGGLYDNIRSMGPEDLGQLERLQREHGVLLAEMDRFTQRVGTCLEGPVAELLREAGHLAERLRQHESRENAFLQDAAYTDHGHGD
jgi:hemerythrin-like domain-containing protein